MKPNQRATEHALDAYAARELRAEMELGVFSDCDQGLIVIYDAPPPASALRPG